MASLEDIMSRQLAEQLHHQEMGEVPDGASLSVPTRRAVAVRPAWGNRRAPATVTAPAPESAEDADRRLAERLAAQFEAESAGSMTMASVRAADSAPAAEASEDLGASERNEPSADSCDRRNGRIRNAHMKG